MVKNWIQNVVVFMLLMSLIGQLVPEEKYRKYVRLTLGLILILVLLLPVVQIFGMDAIVFENLIQSQMEAAAADARSSGKTMDMQRLYTQTYEQMIVEEVKAYFELEAVDVRYCHIEMETNVESESYGKLYSMSVGVCLKGEEVKEKEPVKPIDIEDVSIGKTLGSEKVQTVVPEEKFKKWKQDLTLQFDLNEDQFVLEIVS